MSSLSSHVTQLQECLGNVAMGTATDLKRFGILKLYLIISVLQITLNPCQIFWLIT